MAGLNTLLPLTERQYWSKLLTRTEIVVVIVGIVPIHIELAVVAVEVHARHVAIRIPFFA